MGSPRIQRVYANWFKRWTQRLGLEKQLVSIYYHIRYRFAPETLSLSTDYGSAEFYVPNARVRERLTNLHSSEFPVLNDLSARVEPGDTFFDVGAHVGLYSCLVGDVIDDGRIVAFEPNAGRATLLELNLRINGVCGDVLRYGLSDRESTEGLDVPSSANLRVRRGDDLVASGRIPEPDVLKIDVEGAELQTISGLADTLLGGRCRLLYCEIHPSPAREADRPVSDDEPIGLRQLLKERGFTVERIHQRDSQPFIRAERR